jgi:hypothetical protein
MANVTTTYASQAAKKPLTNASPSAAAWCGLTFELNGERRCGAWPAWPMIRTTGSRAKCHAGASRLQRRVRPRLVDRFFAGLFKSKLLPLLDLSRWALMRVNRADPLSPRVDSARSNTHKLERLHMVTSRRTLLLALAGSPLILLLAPGCSTRAPSAGSFEETPVGTVLTYNRRLSGSFGSGHAKAVWTYAEGEWQGRRVLRAMNSLGGGTLHDPKTFGIVANLNAAGQPTMSYEPPIGIEWPIAVGKVWSTKHLVTLHASNQQVPFETSWTIEAQETIKVPAGSFNVFRAVRTGSDGEVETRWISLQRGVPLVKRTLVRSATHRQGAGTQEAELAEYKVPDR